MNNLIDLLNYFHPLSDSVLLELQGMVSKETFAKGTVLLRPGEVCEHLYFMEKGFAKGSYLVNNVEITSWFWQENDLVTSLESFLRQAPSVEYIKTNEECTMWVLTYGHLQQLYKEHLEFNIVGRKIIEDYFLRAGAIATDLRKLTAKEKYDKLFKEHPEIFQRTSLESIASYLGISQETLSRIRGM